MTRGTVTDEAGNKRKKLLPEEAIGTRSSSRLKEKEVLKASREDRTVPMIESGPQGKKSLEKRKPVRVYRRPEGQGIQQTEMEKGIRIYPGRGEEVAEVARGDEGPERSLDTYVSINDYEEQRIPDEGEVILMGNGVQENATTPNIRHESLGENEFQGMKTPEGCSPVVLKWFNSVHNALSGHNGVGETMGRLFELPSVRTRALRKNLPKDLIQTITRLVKCCPTCEKNSFRKPRNVASHFTCSTYVKMRRIAIDYIENLKPDERGNDMIVVIIDCFSRWVSLTPVQSKGATVFADAYIAWLGLCFGEPEEILTDRGAQFTSRLAEMLISLTGGKLIFTTAGSKQENAIVERANREVMRHLRNIVMDMRAMDEWTRHVPFVGRIMNTMIHSSTGVKPCSIVLSEEMSHTALKTLLIEEEGVVEAIEDREETPLEWEDQWIKRLKDRQKWYIEKAVASLVAGDELHRATNPKVTTSYEVGSLVLCEQGTSFRRGPEHKLLPFLAGPFEVMAAEGDTYTIRNLITNKLRSLHVANLHPYVDDGYQLPPEFAAVADMAGTYLVDHIVRCDPANQVQKKKLRDLRFLVRWLGYEEKFDTWETWSTLKKTPQFRTFLEAHTLKKYRELVKELPLLDSVEEDNEDD